MTQSILDKLEMDLQTTGGVKSKYLFDYILSEEFGQVPEIQFYKQQRIKISEEKIVNIISLFQDLKPKHVIYKRAGEFINKHITYYYENNTLSPFDKPAFCKTDPLTNFTYSELINKIMTAWADFYIGFFEDLLIDLSKALQSVYNQLGLERVDKLIELKEPILKKEDHLSLSPLLLPFSEWKETIEYHLLPYKKHKELFEIKKFQVASTIKELENRLSTSEIPILLKHKIEYSKLNKKKLEIGNDLIIIVDWENFQYKQISEYVDFIMGLNPSNADSINLLISPKKINSILEIFFEKQQVDLTTVKRGQIKKFISNTCSYDKEKYSFKTEEGDTIQFLSNTLLTRLCHLLFYLEKRIALEIKSNSALVRLLKSEFDYLKIGTDRRKSFTSIRTKAKDDLLKKSSLKLSDINHLLPK